MASSSTSAPASTSTPPATSSSSPPPSPYAGAASSAGGLVRGRNPRTGRRGHYTAIVGAEYLACMVMILASLGLVPNEKGGAGTVVLAPAVAMVRLTAVSLLFFGLAILSTGEQLGRLAAMFGGLVTAGVALNATEMWKRLAELFNPGDAAAHQGSGGDEGGGGQIHAEAG